MDRLVKHRRTVVFMALLAGLVLRLLLLHLPPQYFYLPDHLNTWVWTRHLYSEGIFGVYGQNRDDYRFPYGEERIAVVQRPFTGPDGTSYLPGDKVKLPAQKWSFTAINYPPFYVYIRYVSALLLHHLDPRMEPLTRRARLSLQLPTYLADFFLALGCLFIVGRRQGERAGMAAFLLMWFSPAVILTGVLWDQCDAWFLALGVWCGYFLMERKWVTAGAIGALMVLTKPQGAFMVPPILFFLATRGTARPLLKFTAAALITTVVVTAPFMLQSGLAWVKNSYLYHFAARHAPFTTLEAFNVWMLDLVLGEGDPSLYATISGVEKRWWGLLFVLLGIFWSFRICYRRYGKNDLALPMSVALSFAVIFLFSTRVHERFLIYVLPFLLISTLIEGRYWVAFIGYSLLAFFEVINHVTLPPALNLAGASVTGRAALVVLSLTSLSLFLGWIYEVAATKRIRAGIPAGGPEEGGAKTGSPAGAVPPPLTAGVGEANGPSPPEAESSSEGALISSASSNGGPISGDDGHHDVSPGQGGNHRKARLQGEGSPLSGDNTQPGRDSSAAEMESSTVYPAPTSRTEAAVAGKDGAAPYQVTPAMETILFFSALVCLALLWLTPRPIGDLFISLAAGRDILTDGLYHPDTGSFTTAGRVWINQNWGSHLLFYGVYRFCGPGGLLVLKFLLITACSVLTALAAQEKGVPFFVSLAVSAWVFFWMYDYVDLRPNLVFFTLVALNLWILYGAGRRPARLWWLCLILPAWANLHGSFVLGALMTVIWWASVGRDTRWPILSALLLTTVLIPFGWDNLYATFVTGASGVWRYVREWAPVWVSIPNGGLFPFFALLVTFLGLVVFHLLTKEKVAGEGVPPRRGRGERIFEIVVIAITFVMALSARRFIPVAILVCLPCLCYLVWHALVYFRKEVLVLSLALAAPLLALLMFYQTSLPWYGKAEMSGNRGDLFAQMHLIHARYPLRMAAFINKAEVAGRLFTDWQWEGFFRWHCPQMKVFIGGRAQQVYDEETFRRYMTAFSGRATPEDLAAWGVQYVALRREGVFAPLVEKLTRAYPRWAPLYEDDLYILLRRQRTLITTDGDNVR